MGRVIHALLIYPGVMWRDLSATVIGGENICWEEHGHALSETSISLVMASTSQKKCGYYYILCIFLWSAEVSMRVQIGHS